MDTWLKKLACSKVSRGITLVGIYIVTFVMILSIMGMRMVPQETSYFDSMDFRELFVKKAGYVRDWIVRYDEDKIFSQVTQNDIDKYIAGSGKEISQQEAIEGILADRNNYYSTIQNELVITNKNLEYLAVDITTGRRITNMPDRSTDELMKELTSRPNYLIGNGYYILNLKYGTGRKISYYSDQYTTDMNYFAGKKFEGQDHYRIYVAIKEDLVPGDDFYVAYQYANSYQVQEKIFYNMCVVALILDLLLVAYWIMIVGFNCRYTESSSKWFDRMPLEVQCMIGSLVYLVALVMYRFFTSYAGGYSIIQIGIDGIQYKPLGTMIFFAICFLPILVSIRLLSSIVRHINNHTMIEHIGSYKVVRDLYRMKQSRTKTLIVIAIVIGINIIVDCIVGFAIDDYFYAYGVLALVPSVVWNLLCGILMIKLVVDYKKILQAAQAITEGELDRKVELGTTLPILNEMADTVNSMGTGLEKAVGESIKSERLKTELITNVSHDLKTPLTSIISYIDLLKGENIENATARDYINVLDERSHRLKQLVEDLVEASKAVTGNLKAEIQVLRLDELVGQALGEYQDRIEASGLILVSDKMQEVYALADGRHMWRIIENLLSNVCKYAMPYTRVYVEVYHQDGYGYCTIKNISKEPLDINPEELTERFVRGDASRTTEGSGLGLAIAQSLILLQQGALELTIDGDLFKATVKIPLANRVELSLDKSEG